MTNRFALVLVTSLASTMNASTANPLVRSEQLAVRDIAAYLELDSRQQQDLQSQLVNFSRKWQVLRRLDQAGHAGTEGSNRDIQLSAVAAELCRQSQALQSEQRTQLRSLLNPRQVDRLRELEDAFSLLPKIEAAQSLGLMADHLQLPPAGLPTGSVTVPTGWRRVAATPLPGCLAETRVMKEVELKGVGEPKAPARN